MAKVLFIGGTGRTGSTLVDRILGSSPNWLSGGELAFFWRFGLKDGGLCSCGEEIARCPFWSAALEIAADSSTFDPQRMIDLRKRFWSAHLPLMIFPSLSRRKLDQLEEFPRIVGRLYEAALEISGNKVLVDSSKDVHYSYLMRERSGIDLYFLHLVRDPRAIGNSWQRRRVETGFGGRSEMERRGLLKTTTYFTVSNLAAEALWRKKPDRYRLLRYEDFVEDPVSVCQQIAEFVGEDIDLRGVLEGHRFQPSSGHTTWGNPNRFENSQITIRKDDGWKSEQAHWKSFLLGLMNTPLAGRYGYRSFRFEGLGSASGRLATSLMLPHGGEESE